MIVVLGLSHLLGSFDLEFEMSFCPFDFPLEKWILWALFLLEKECIAGKWSLGSLDPWLLENEPQ